MCIAGQNKCYTGLNLVYIVSARKVKLKYIGDGTCLIKGAWVEVMLRYILFSQMLLMLAPK